MTTTTKTLLALCISLASAMEAAQAGRRASPSASLRSSSPGSGTHNWTTAVPKHGALRVPAPQGESVVRSGARTFALGASSSGLNTFSTFEHQHCYEGDNEEARKAVTWRQGGAIVDVHFAEGHAHVGVAKLAAREKRIQEQLDAYHAEVDALKKERDAEQEQLMKRRFKDVRMVVKDVEMDVEEKRYAPNVLRGDNPLNIEDEVLMKLGDVVEGIWSPKALTEAQFEEYLGGNLVIDQDTDAYDYLHCGQKGQMVDFSADPKHMKGKNEIYAEAAHEFFWRRAPAVFTYKEDAERVVDTTARTHQKKDIVKQHRAAAKAYAPVKIINRKPWTQKHFRWCVQDGDVTADDWEAVEKCEPGTSRAIAAAQKREQDYKNAKSSKLEGLINIQKQKVAEPNSTRADRLRLTDLTVMLAELTGAALPVTDSHGRILTA